MTPSFKDLMISRMRSLGNPTANALSGKELGNAQKNRAKTRAESVAWNGKELSHGFEG